MLRLGAHRATVKDPGLHVKVPLIEEVVRYDQRLLSLEPPAEEIILGDQKRIVVDTYTRYRIADPVRFYQAVRAPSRTDDRLMPSFASALRTTLGDNTLEELVRDNRAGIALVPRLGEIGDDIGALDRETASADVR